MCTPATRGRMAEIEKKTKRYPTDLTVEEWARIEPFLPGAAKSRRRTQVGCAPSRNSCEGSPGNLVVVAGDEWPAVQQRAQEISAKLDAGQWDELGLGSAAAPASSE